MEGEEAKTAPRAVSLHNTVIFLLFLTTLVAVFLLTIFCFRINAKVETLELKVAALEWRFSSVEERLGYVKPAAVAETAGTQRMRGESKEESLKAEERLNRGQREARRVT